MGFIIASALVHELMEAKDERRLLNLQRNVSRLGLLIIDELGFVPLSSTGAELLYPEGCGVGTLFAAYLRRTDKPPAISTSGG